MYGNGGLAATGVFGSAVILGYHVSGLGLAVATGVVAVVGGAALYRFGRKGKRAA